MLFADLWKNYYTTMLNIIFFMVLQIRTFLSSVAPSKELGFECKEDSVTDNLLKLIMAEVVLRYLYYIFWNITYKIKSKTNKNFDWRTEFELSDEFVWILVLYCQVWMCMLMYPVLCFIGTIAIYLHCRFLIYRLNNQKR